jgi:hypothetical protein
MPHCGVHCRGLVVAVLMAFASFAVHIPAIAQNRTSKESVKVVLISSTAKGLSRAQLETLFASLQKKVSQFEMLSVILENDLKKELNPADRAALDKCSSLSCLQQVSAKAGVERIVLCSVTLQGDAYHFESSEYGIKNSVRLSTCTVEAVCASSEEINDYVTKISVVMGQKIARTDNVPESLRPSTTSWWWYAGGALIVGAGAGIYLLTKQSKTGSAADNTLPTAPALP